MPSYDYECTKCKRVEENIHKMSENPTFTCYTCNIEMNKVILSSPVMRMANTVGGKWVGDSSVYTSELRRKKRTYFKGA